MDDAAFQAWLARHGGEVGRKNNEKQADGEVSKDTGLPTKVTVVDTTTITAKDGATITLRRKSTTEDGSSQYEIVAEEPPKAATASNVATTRRIEGTPLPGGGFDNTQPIAVNRDANGQQVGQAEPLTAKEREDWERKKNGGKTDAELREPPKPRQSRVNPADPTKMQEFDPTTGQWVDAGVNAAGVQAAADRDKPKPEKAPDGSYGYWDTKQTPPKWVPIANAPGAATPAPVEINGVYGVWKPGANGGPPTFEAIPNQPGQVKVPADAPQIDNSSPQAAFDSYNRLFQWVDARVRDGTYNPTQGKAILEGPHQAVEMQLNREKELRNRQQQEVTNALTLRGQDVSRAGTALTNSTSQFGTALDAAQKTNLLADPGTGAAASTLLGTLALQALYSNQMGGMREPNMVVPGPMANLPAYTPPALPAPAMAGATPDAGAASSMAEQQRAAAAASAAHTPAAPAAVGGPPAAPPVAAPPAASAPGLIPMPGLPSQINATTTMSNDLLDNLVGPRPTATGPGSVGAAATDDIMQHPSMAPPPASPSLLAPFQDEQVQVPPFNADPNQGPVGMMGAPVMALASTFGGGADPYAEARASLKRMGISDDIIEQELQGFMRGAA